MWILFLDYQVLEGWKEHITRNMKQVSADHPAMEKKKIKKRSSCLLLCLLCLLPYPLCLLHRNQLKTK